LRQMRSKDFENQKTGRKQRGLVKLSALSRRLGAHSACIVHLNHDEAGEASNSHFSAGLVDLGNYFSRVGDCENRGGIDCLMNGTRHTPTVRSGMERSAQTFLHGSADVRASSLVRSFSKQPPGFLGITGSEQKLCVRKPFDISVPYFSALSMPYQCLILALRSSLC
jgi:hypothetical protein